MILVTGGTGLVGSHLLYKLATNGDKIIALIRDKNRIEIIIKVFSYYSNNQNLIKNIEFIEGDVLDKSLIDSIMHKVDLVYHCAAVVSFLPKDAALMHQINVGGTTNIVTAARKHNIKKLCFVSSTAAIGKDKDGGFNTEDTNWYKEGASNYSVTKYLSEQEVWKAVKQGLNCVIVNPSIILGPGDWGKSSTSLFNETYKGLGFYTTGANAFVDVRDVAASMIELMHSKITNERFLVISENITFEQLFKLIAKALNKKSPKVRAKPFLTGIAWRFEKLKFKLTGKVPRITKESAKSGQSTQLFSNEKIKKTIGYNFITVEQSIKDTGILFLKDANR
jgi:dihydroflavonol-4-reductase